MTLPVPKLETPAMGPVPFCAPSPKAQGAKGGHPRKTMLSSTTGPTQTCPFCSAPYVEPAASTRLGVAHPPKNGGSRSEAQPQPGPPLQPPSIPHPACEGDPVSSARPQSDCLPGRVWNWVLSPQTTGPREPKEGPPGWRRD